MENQSILGQSLVFLNYANKVFNQNITFID